MGYNFFNESLNHIVKRNLSPDRVFNIDETGFAQNRKPKKCVAVTGSKNVWSKSVDANFHFTITACVTANYFILTPMFVVPVQ